MGNNITFVKAYDYCYIEEKRDTESFEHMLNLNEEVEISDSTLSLDESITSETYLKVSLDEPLPLIIRKRQDGDRLIIGNGHKKLKDFLIDKKVPKTERDNLIIVTNNLGEIIWVLGYYKKKCEEQNSLVLNFKEKIYGRKI